MIMMAMMVADDGRVTDRLMVNAEKNKTYIIGKLMEYMQLVKYYALLNIMLCLFFRALTRMLEHRMLENATFQRRR